MIETRTTRPLAWGLALAFLLPGAAQAQRYPETRQVSLPEGTVLRAELTDRLSSTTSQAGDRFTAEIQSDDYDSGLPRGTEVVGHVRSVQRANKDRPATLDVDFRTLRLPDGRTYAIDGSLTSLDAKNVRRTSSGRLEARNTSSKDKTKFIGYGAGAGALIGILSGGDTLTSALLGAAAGYLYGELNKDKQSNGSYSEVDLKPGTEFGVRLDRRAAVAASYTGYDPNDDRYTRNGYPYDNRSPRYNGRRPGSYPRTTSRDVRVLLNGRDVRFDSGQPFMAANRVMVPAEPVLRAAGYDYRYEPQDRELMVYGNRGDARLVAGNYYASIDGERVRLDAPAQIVGGVLYVPTQFLEEATDIRTEWDARDRTVRLTTSNRTERASYDDRYRQR